MTDNETKPESPIVFTCGPKPPCTFDPSPVEAAKAFFARATKAEAELAALKARIAEAPLVTLMYAGGHWHDAPNAVMAQARVPDDSWCGKRVRLLVEDDDCRPTHWALLPEAPTS